MNYEPIYASIEEFHSLILCGWLDAFLAPLFSLRDRTPKVGIAVFLFRASIYRTTVSRVGGHFLL